MSTKRLSLKLLTISGVALLIIGVTLFFNSLGRGGGFLATFLAALGAMSLLIALLWFIVRSVHSRQP